MYRTNIHHIKKQTLYLILFLTIFTVISFTNTVPKEYSKFLSVGYVLSISYMIYLVMSLRKIAKKKFSSFLLFLALSFSVMLTYLIFTMFYPINLLNDPLFRLTSTNTEGFLPHSLFRYLEALLLFFAFILMLTMNASKQAKKDLIFTGIIILSTLFTLTITIINVILERFYGEHFKMFHLAALFNIVYASIAVLFMYTSLMKRVLVYGRLFVLYFVCCMSFVICNGILLLQTTVDFFWMDIHLIDSIRLLFRAILLYGITIHVSKNETIKFLENPHLDRMFIFYFVSITLLNLAIEMTVKTSSVYYYVCTAITITALGARLLFIKHLDEHANEQLRRLAHLDDLTNLENQKKLFIDIQSFITNQAPFIIILVNISRFKQINNLLTYEVGNTILNAFVERLKHAITKISPISTIYRYGGDEFIIVTHSEHTDDVTNLCNHIFNNLAEPFEIKNERIKILANIGITTYPDDASTMDELLKNLNSALKEAKLLPIHGYKFYSKEMAVDMREKLEIEKDLYAGLEHGEFELFYQPQYSLNRELVGFEALIRWNHPTKGFISPMNFIPIAEETGLIVPLGEWILSEACQQLTQWIDLYDVPLKMSINISARQLQQANFVSRVEEIIQNFHLPTSLIMLEITETYPFYTEPELVERIAHLRAIGCKISIDDFGTGFCSLTSLTIVPIDQIKIAREYIQTIGTNSKEEMLLKHLFTILDSMSFNIIAEGVETAEQLDELKNTQCNYIQGFYFSKPLNLIDATNIFKESVENGKILVS